MLFLKYIYFALLLLVAGFEASNVCPNEFVLIGKKCYRFSHEPLLDYYAAMKYCNNLNANLARIKKSKEFRKLHQYLAEYNPDTSENYWIEGIDLRGNGNFIWQSTNKEMPFKLWSPAHRIDESSENTFHKCVLLVRDNQRRLYMETKACTYADNFICEKVPLDNQRSHHYIATETQLRPNAARRGCAKNFNRIGDSCYLFANFVKEFDRAAEHCLAFNSNLVVIERPNELQLLNDFLLEFNKSLAEGYWAAFRSSQDDGYDVTLINNTNRIDFEQLRRCVPREINDDIYYFRHRSCQTAFEEHKFICKAPAQIQ